MRALILNSGLGTRMGDLTTNHPKCMTEITEKETILSRQLRQLAEANISEVIITTGPFDNILVNYCQSLDLPLSITFVKNPKYQNTNYIYSIYCAREYLHDDIILLHGDLVLEDEVLEQVLAYPASCMAVSSALPLPEKDFKAVIHNGRITKIGIDFFNEALSAQPLYKLQKQDWEVWMNKITEYCENSNVSCYAENAFNEISNICRIYPLDFQNLLCSEIDNPEDLAVISSRLKEIEHRTVYMCFSTDIIHSGHISIIKKAEKLGKLIIGVLSDEAVANYKRFPLLPFSERKTMLENIAGVYKVVE